MGKFTFGIFLSSNSFRPYFFNKSAACAEVNPSRGAGVKSNRAPLSEESLTRRASSSSFVDFLCNIPLDPMRGLVDSSSWCCALEYMTKKICGKLINNFNLD